MSLRAGLPPIAEWTAATYLQAYAAGMPVAIAGDYAKMVEWLNTPDPAASPAAPPASIVARETPRRRSWIIAAIALAALVWFIFLRKK